MPRKPLTALFVDYWHNFCTVSHFADYYGLSMQVACRCLAWGKLRYNRECNQPPQFTDDLTIN